MTKNNSCSPPFSSALSKLWKKPDPLSDSGGHYSVHQMGTKNKNECCPYVRDMTIQQAVIYIYERSEGKILFVAAKYDETVIINPTYAHTEDALGPR